jgi:hypothetical protein
MLKRKGLNNLHYSQTNCKKYRVEEDQPTPIRVISGKEREMVEEKNLRALEKLKQSSKKRKTIEGQTVIEREKKSKQRAETLTSALTPLQRNKE